MKLLSGSEVSQIRRARGWTQQYLARVSAVNKAYISEYESGVRSSLPEEMLRRISEVLLQEPAGRVRVEIRRVAGRSRLVLVDADQNEYVPKIASVHWTEEDGTSYSMFLGEVE